jgi:RHS repeat-associated protein
MDELLTSTRNGQTYYYHEDDLDNIQKVTGSSGNVVEQYRYGDYGQPSFYSGSGTPLTSSAIGNYTLFGGHRFDLETGLYYQRSRYLDPVAGRFTSRDVIGIWGDPASLGNGFTYTGNNPESFVDPFGGWCWNPCSHAKAGISASLTFNMNFCNGNYSLSGSVWAGIGVAYGSCGCDHFSGWSYNPSGTIASGNSSYLKWFNCGTCASGCGPNWLNNSSLSWLKSLSYENSVSFDVWIVSCTASASVSGNCRASVGVECSADLLSLIPGAEEVTEALEWVGAEAEVSAEGDFSLTVCPTSSGGVTACSALGSIGISAKIGWGL